MNLKDRRKQLKLTMLQVADYVGVSEATVSRWESGNIANMKRDKIVKLAEILQVSPVDIMGKENNNLNATQTAFLELFNQLNTEQQTQLTELIKTMLKK